MHKLKVLISKFKEYMEIQNFSDRTISDYPRHLKYFLEYLETSKVTDLLEIDKELVLNYQRYLYNYCIKKGKNKGKPISLETQYARLTAVKTFFRYLERNNYIAYDPAASIELPKRKRNLPRGIMTKREISKILNQPDCDTALGLRDKAILETLYSTGIRNTELRKLTVYDIDITNNELRVNQGKGKKDRIVPLGEISGKYISLYLSSARQEFMEKQKEESSLLFLSINGKQITQANLVWIIAKYVKKAKLKKAITTHSFRHTCAVHMLRGGANLRHIQEMLGHGCISTTQNYTHIEVSDLKREHRKSHPRERVK